MRLAMRLVDEPTREAVQEKIDTELRMVGLEHYSASIAQRMRLLEVVAARFNNDSRTIGCICQEVLERIAETVEPELQSALSADGKRDLSIAAYLHDIGKSGPLDASPESQETVVKLYAVEHGVGPDQTIQEILFATFSSEEATRMLQHLRACGMRPTDTMREFWDRHGYWTHDILEDDAEDIPVRARVVAASHHMDRGIDPYGCPSDDRLAMLESRILMAVDKYQAAIRRGHKSHAEAIELVTRLLAPKYSNDGMMNRVLMALDALGNQETLVADAA